MSRIRMTPLRAALVLGSLEIFGPISMDLYMPALPELARDLGTSDALTQGTMSACMIGLGVGQLITGPLSDRVGRRRPMIIGVLAFVVFSIACAYAPTIEMLLAMRFLQGLAGSAGIVLTFAAARDMFEGIELARLLSLLALVGALAPILAPIAGGQLTTIMDWRGIFLVLAGVGAVLLIIAITALPETLPVDHRQTGPLKEVGEQFAGVFRDRVFVAMLIVAACGGIAFFTYLASISFVVQAQFGMSPQLFSLIFAGNSIMMMAGSQINRIVVRKVGLRQMYIFGTTLAAVISLAVLAITFIGPNPWIILGALAILMSAYGITSPNGAALTMESHGARAGTAAALFGTATFVIGPLIAPIASLGGTTALSMTSLIATGSVGAAILARVVALPLLKAREEASAAGTTTPLI